MILKLRNRTATKRELLRAVLHARESRASSAKLVVASSGARRWLEFLSRIFVLLEACEGAELPLLSDAEINQSLANFVFGLLFGGKFGKFAFLKNYLVIAVLIRARKMRFCATFELQF